MTATLRAQLPLGPKGSLLPGRTTADYTAELRAERRGLTADPSYCGRRSENSSVGLGRSEGLTVREVRPVSWSVRREPADEIPALSERALSAQIPAGRGGRDEGSSLARSESPHHIQGERFALDLLGWSGALESRLVTFAEYRKEAA